MTQFSSEQMKTLTQNVIAQMEEWEVATDEMLAILGLEGKVKARHLPSYRKGEKVIPQTPDCMARVDHVMGIAEALHTTFPFSNQMRVLWLRKPHRRFQKRTPLSVMLAEGSNGLMRVRIEVDCAYGYAISDAMHAAAQQR